MMNNTALPSADSVAPANSRSGTAAVPRTIHQAVRTFFFSGDFGPSIVVVALAGIVVNRLTLMVGQPPAMADIPAPISAADIAVFVASILFWWVQEHALHQHVLHSKADWIGKQIHQEHHDLPYHHVSIDPAWMLLSWLGIAHLVLRCVLPLPLALSATLGYAGAGLFYEWAHYIVHTRVPMRSKFWKQVRDNHIRHHKVNSDYWFAFSLPIMDDWFGTNPSLSHARETRR